MEDDSKEFIKNTAEIDKMINIKDKLRHGIQNKRLQHS